MTIFLLVLLLIALGVIVQQWRYRRRIVKTSTRLIGNLHHQNSQLTDAISLAEANYDAHVTGTEELIDNYENDFLDFKKQIETAKNSAAYDRGLREEAEKKLAQWDAAIMKHADHCDTILEEMVDVMMKEIQPQGE